MEGKIIEIGTKRKFSDYEYSHEYKELMITHPYFEDFFEKYDTLYWKYDYPILALPLSWFVMWFMLQDKYDNYEIIRSEKSIKFIRTDDSLDIRLSGKKFSNSYKIRIFDDICNIINQEEFETIKKMFGRRYIFCRSIMKYFEGISEKLDSSGFDIFQPRLEIPDCKLIKTISIIISFLFDTSLIEEKKILPLYTQKINQFLQNEYDLNMMNKWLILHNLPFVILIDNTKKVVANGIIGSPSLLEQVITPAYKLNTHVIHRSIYDNYISQPKACMA